MPSINKQIISFLKKDYPDFIELKESDFPNWLKESRWNPVFCLYSNTREIYLAVDVQPSGLLPETLLRKEISLLNKNYKDQLRVIICTTHEGFFIYPDSKYFCEKMKIGLRILEPGLGLMIEVNTDLDLQSRASIVKENGYFPKAILDKAEDIDKLMFKDIVLEFIKEIRIIQSDGDSITEKTKDLVIKTVDRLLDTHPSLRDKISHFMKLEHFENILELAAPESSEHIFHSFRVFLAGCPIINRFYDCFLSAQDHYKNGCNEVYVEYSWLLISIFHDIGRPKEGAKKLAEKQFSDDEHVEISVQGNPDRWRKPDYITSLRILGSLAAIVSGQEWLYWDGGGIPDENGKLLADEWIKIYDEFSSHAVISAIDIFTEICEKAKAADDQKYRPFILAHFAPAALSILLHDWKIHKKATKWKLFPLNVERFPLAALLHYIDTWDDYKRIKSQDKIFIKDFKFTDKSVNVIIEWSDATDFQNEQIKYNAFKKALCNRAFRMIITPRMAQ